MGWSIKTSGNPQFSRSSQEFKNGDSVKAVKPACRITTIEGTVEKVGEVSSLIKGTDGTVYLVLNSEIIGVLPKKV